VAALRAAIALMFAIACVASCSRTDAPPAAKAADPACMRADVAAAGNSLAVFVERSRTLVLQVQAYPNDQRHYVINLETDLKELDLLAAQAQKERVPACANQAKELAVAAIRGIHDALDLRRPDVDQDRYKKAFDAAQDTLASYNAEIRRVAIAAAP
jgi:hypothetical protein